MTLDQFKKARPLAREIQDLEQQCAGLETPAPRGDVYDFVNPENREEVELAEKFRRDIAAIRRKRLESLKAELAAI